MYLFMDAKHLPVRGPLKTIILESLEIKNRTKPAVP